MCIPATTVALATAVCVICTRVRPQPVCPHTRAICRERQNHPGQCEISYFVNAEYDVFNGCGFCKWATATRSTGKNPGWPGCCRAPLESECDLISDGSWRVVGTVWRIPIPDRVSRRLNERTASIAPRKAGGSPVLTRGTLRGGALEKESTRGGGRSLAQSRSDRPEAPRPSLGFSAKPSQRPSHSRSNSLSGNLPTLASSRQRSSDNFAPYGISQLLGDSKTSKSSTRGQPSLSQVERSLDKMDISQDPDPSSYNRRASIASMSDMTDFTDYLSDESDIRLQREAETRVVDRRKMVLDEAEYMQARKRLESVGTDPPAGWYGNGGGPRTYQAYNAGPPQQLPPTRAIPVTRFEPRENLGRV